MIAEVFSKDNCPFCVRAIDLLGKKDADIDVTKIETEAQREMLIDRVTEATGEAPRSVPQIFIDGEYVGGYTDLVAWFATQDSVSEGTA